MLYTPITETDATHHGSGHPKTGYKIPRLTPRGLCVMCDCDDFAYSSMAAAIFHLAFTITL